MTIFFTADTHFGSERTLHLSRRPFSSVTEMDRSIVANWNNIVSKDDTVYHLGDFGAFDQLNGLKGKIIFLPGNYDESEFTKAMSKRCKIIDPNTIIKIDSHSFQLIHEPDEASLSGLFFLFGHIHSLQMVKRNGLNVGVDCHDFYPVSLETVLFYRNGIENHYDENVFQCSLGASDGA